MGSVIDLFSGTSRVGYALKQRGYQVYANDHNEYAFHLARCYIETDREEVDKALIELIQEMNRLPGKPGYFTDTFCEKARFFHPKNGERVDAIRHALEQKGLPPRLYSVMLVSLMEAADRVDSTCGIQMAYLKQWAKRAHQDLALRLPNLLPRAQLGKGRAHCLDALDAAKHIEAEVAYLDPPYNQHSYRSNYHIWETLVKWDQPDVYGKANKRVDCQTQKSDFNSKRRFLDTLFQVFQSLRAKHIVLSFNDEGFANREQLEKMLCDMGKLSVYYIDYKRYVGAQIGIYNQMGQKVGKVKKLRNKELLYVLHKGG